MGGPTWTPLAEGAPVFQVFRADDSVVKSLAQSQVALHEQRAAYNALRNATAKDKEEWARLKEELVRFACQLYVAASRCRSGLLRPLSMSIKCHIKSQCARRPRAVALPVLLGLCNA